jgi:hypothetical protein
MIAEVLGMAGLVLALVQFLKKPFPFINGAVAIVVSGVVSFVVAAARFPLSGTPFVPLTWIALSLMIFFAANGAYGLVKVASGNFE